MDWIQGTILGTVAVVLVLALGWLVGVHARKRGGGDRVVGLLKIAVTPLVRLYWGARFRGLGRIPDPIPEPGLVLVCNHTSGLDPVLVNWGCNLRIRWMMSRAMMTPLLGPLWHRLGVLPIEFSERDRASVTEAIRILRAGGVVGIFPEGRIARPPEVVQPFQPGLGLLVARTGASVLLMHSQGPRPGRSTFGSLLRPCRARVTVVELIDYRDRGLKARAITEDLRQRLHRATGWPLEDISPEASLARD